ncbi:hypothetical protein DEU56DRAFT_917978 [Suillus clintonianus]|uniref:uncharacterized protein n=1 Tax=Suillus clintonianus TaxID=1904413 RepID=UPI001B884FF8|nr:uncharacterized protein DEU56DRAFT_917978 [Suillus clintonianus]KAG2121979.1 hypothetical protein DEU56DRAFT_917978 [Suillus clintonianus]
MFVAHTKQTAQVLHHGVVRLAVTSFLQLSVPPPSTGGHQEDAEEFLGFYLDTLEEELLTLSSSLTNPNQAPTQQNNNAPANNMQEEGWLEVGKHNRTVLCKSPP